MIKQVCLGLLTCFGLVSCTSAPVATNCRQFETGNFMVRHLDPQNGFSYLISRHGGTQTETDQQTGDVSELAVKWTGPCTYELRLLKSTKHFSPELEAIRKNSTLKTEILSYTDAYYIFRSRRTDDELGYTDTLWIKK
jgi:hypothetical protein